MDVTGRVRADTLQRPHTAALTMALPTVQDNGGVALFPQTLHQQHHQHHHYNRRRRLFGCGDEDGDNNNTVDRSPTYIDNTTLLVDELEGLRSDNFQLRLRVYNAEQRVDELTAAADEATWCCRRCGGRSRVASFSTESDAGTSETGSVDDDCESSSTAAAAAEKAAAMASMAKSAVRTISDLMTVNQRLISLLNAVLSAKPVSKSDEDDRRWQTLRNQIKQYCDVSSLALQGAAGARPQYDQDDYDGYDEDDEDTDSEDDSTEPIIVEEREVAPVATTATTTVAATIAAATTAATTTTTGTYTVATSTCSLTTNDDGGGGGVDDEVVRLRARCQQLELSIQQLVNTELWARNRQISKLEQQRCAMAAAQQQQQRQQHRDDTAASTRPPAQRSQPAATSTPARKGILVQRPCRPLALSSDPRPEVMKSPPPVLPDYSEVNFFFSCDEEDDLQPSHRPEVDAAAPWSWSSSYVSDDGTESEDEKPAYNNNNNNDDYDRPGRRQSFRRGYRHKYLNSTVRAESATPAAPVAVADAQVQCDRVPPQDLDDGQAQQRQVQQLRRELDARRRENSRLYEMLLKLQRDKDRTAGETPSPSPSPPSRDTASSSPEPYGRAARDVRSRIADLLPPLLTRTTGAAAATTGGGSSPGSAACSPPRDDDDGRPPPPPQQQQQQMNVLNRLRDRIVEYERQVLLGKEDAGGTTAAPGPEVAVDSDAENAEVRRMDRAALVNVALPRVVDRFRRVLQVQQQQQQQRPAHEVQEPAFSSGTSTESGECNLRRRRTPSRT